MGVSRTFMTLIFMTYPATLSVLRSEWHMSATAAGSISTGFQAGFAVSLLGCSWLADRVGARRVFLVSSALAALTSLALALLARSYVSGLFLYTLAAVSQGGTYTTAIMLIADRFDPERRGGALGWLIASSSLGSALSLAIAGVTLPRGGYPLTFLVTGCGPLVGWIVAWTALRDEPTVVHQRHRNVRFGGEVLRNRNAVRLIVGYVFHSWELLAMWAWTPAFLAASLALSATRLGGAASQAGASAAYLAASFHVMGLLASSTMGRLSDRLGRRTVLLALSAISTACSFAIGWLIGWPAGVVVAVGALYGFAALGDSPVLSTALTESVRPAYLGSALGFRSILGFGAGAVAPLVFGAVLDATNPPGTAPATWGWAYGALGAGGLIATVCAFRLDPSRSLPDGRDAAAVVAK
jgi:MFS family permease